MADLGDQPVRVAAQHPHVRAVHPASGSSSPSSSPRAASRSAAPSRASCSTSPCGRCRWASSAPGSTTCSRTPTTTSSPAPSLEPVGRCIRNIWEGGNAIYGSLIGGAIGVLHRLPHDRASGSGPSPTRSRPACWSHRPSAGSATGSTTSSSACPPTCPGASRSSPTNPAFPAGLAEGTLFHPTFLYEIIWNLAGAALIILLERRINLRWGKAFAIYLIWYGLGRSFFEAIRVDPSEMFLGVRVNVWASWAAVVLGIVLFLVQRRRHTGDEPHALRTGP